MSNSCKRILIVEDDKKLAQLTQEYLVSKGGYEVELEHQGNLVEQRVRKSQFDLIILDIMLPGLDGLSVCKVLRPIFAGPILMLTALGDEVDEIVGLEVGADDYLPKPASPRLLLARVKVLLRRTENSATQSKEQSAKPANTTKFVFDELVVDDSDRTVVLGGEELDTSTAEFDLLWFLCCRAGTIIPREEIYKSVRGIEWDGLDRSVDQRIKRLRQKLNDDAQHPRWIKSIRGTGYLFVAKTTVKDSG